MVTKALICIQKTIVPSKHQSKVSQVLHVQKQVSDLSNPPSSIQNDSDLAELDFSFKGLPYIPYSSDEADFQLQVRGLLPLMLLIASVPQMINIVSVMTNEESKGLVSGLVAFGVWPSLHYVSYFVSSLPNTFINSLMTTIFGVIYGFEVLALGNITVMWIGNFLYQVALTCMGMMFVSLFRKPGVALFAVIATVVVFCCLQIMEGFLMANTGPTIPIYYLWYNLDIMKSPHVAGLLQLLPIFNLNKITKDVFTLNARYKNTTTNDLITPTGFHWEHTAKSIWYESYNKTYPTRFLSNSFTDQIPSTQDSFLYLFGLVFLYFIAALYLDKLIENVNGKFENPWFFLDPAYLKSFLPSVDVANLEEWIKKNHNLSLQYSDQGVSKKADSAYNDKSPFPLRVVDLKKKYGRSANNLAVKGISFTFDQNQLLAFLGQNGGGKSTTLKILSGFLNASSGDAIIYNKSVKKDSFTIQSFAGITSQFDLLYPELNALEHMYMYCELKNVQNPDQIIKDRLTSVLLWDVRKLPTSSYSGGMKRRLSVIISTIGDPKFLILDEPTTGMDPFNRRLVWKFLENFKKGRVILLYFKFI